MKDCHTNVFHVPNARGSQYIPAQDDFVAAYDIESVVGFGDVLPNGDLFAVICFSRVPISEQAAALFSHLSISTKLALMAHAPAADRVEGQITAVDRMIQNYEHVVCEQESLLRGAMSELEHARDAADAANRAKSEFLANMSHEIRTPMNAILGMTELVLGDDIPDQDRDYLNTVLESGESLLNIINEILDFSKIEAGKIELDPSSMDIREVIGDMVKPLAVRAHRKQIELAFAIAPDVPQFVVADVARLRQIIVNLLSNAIKFTDDGEVVVSVSDGSSDDSNIDLLFCVSDTGIGIPEHQLDSIFEAFAQADASTTRRFGGTGLGLAISSDLVQMMGGQITVQSEVDAGSKFSFTLRLPKGDPPQERVQRRPDEVAGMSVLIVDDNDTNRHILDKMLTAWGMIPISTSDADAALSVLRERHASDHPVQVILTDVHMPGTDGFELVQQVRGIESIADTPVIVLTSGAGSGDASRCRDLRVLAHLMKPVKQSELLDALLMTVTDAPTRETVAPAIAKVDEAPQRPLRILLAEDGLANRKLAIGLLARWGHEVETAENGAIAVDLAATQSFDLILMDLQMPVMDGIEATKRIRAAESGTSQRTPIIAMTAHALVGDRQRCLDAGMDDYVSKPIRQQELYRAIGAVAAAEAQSLAADETSGPEPIAGPEPVAVRSAQDGDAVGPLNLDLVLEMMDHDRDILVSVIEAFIEEGPGLLEQIEQGLIQHDHALLRRAAHTLKGNYMILRQPMMHTLSAEVEELARQQRLDDAQGPADELRSKSVTMFRQLKEYIESD
jgi:two-component system sensor histidine kinase/response regulator